MSRDQRSTGTMFNTRKDEEEGASTPLMSYHQADSKRRNTSKEGKPSRQKRALFMDYGATVFFVLLHKFYSVCPPTVSTSLIMSVLSLIAEQAMT